MAAGRFHDKPFDEGTLTKLEIFQLYAREWLPVFLAKPNPSRKQIHVFDFFAGPGEDVNRVQGSPLRLLEEVRRARGYSGWHAVQLSIHFFDRKRRAVDALREGVRPLEAQLPEIKIEIEAYDFDTAWPKCQSALANRDAAKLVLIDQCGVAHVTDERFRQLARFPTCDFLFFISSSTFHRFREHPAIRQKIQRPHDYYHVHRAALDYYRALLPSDRTYYLGAFSLKKGSNIYGLIFGSGHPRGMDKFLQVAWSKDEVHGEADFNIDRDDAGPLLRALVPPTKLTAFEGALEGEILSGTVKNERDVIRVCFEHGVKRQHAQRVLKLLKGRGVIDCAFRVPDITLLKDPRPIRVLGGRG
jgi:three-Cys-motif partner protein